VAIFLDPGAGRKHIESCCAMHPPTALIGSPKAHWLRFISPALRRIPVKFSTGKPFFRARPLLDSLRGLLTANDDLELAWRSAAVHGCEFGRRLAAGTFVERDARRTRRRDACATRQISESLLSLCARIGTVNLRKEIRTSQQRAADVSSTLRSSSATEDGSAEPSVFCRQDAGSMSSRKRRSLEEHIKRCDADLRR
jgi:hypothetical protein